MSEGNQRIESSQRKETGKSPVSLHIPKIKILVHHGPNVLTWMRRVHFSTLPPHLRKIALREGYFSEIDELWFYTFNLGSKNRTKCRLCNQNEPVAALGLCNVCFAAISFEMMKSGILFSDSDNYLLSVSAIRKFLSRIGIIKLHVVSGMMYRIIPGREEQFCNFLNEVLGLKGSERVNVNAMASYLEPDNLQDLDQ